MAYTTEAINQDVTKREKVIDPRYKKNQTSYPYMWWAADNEKDLCQQLLSTTDYLKRQAQMRVRQCSIYARLFNGKPLYNFLASTSTLDTSNQLPIGRPTANVTYSCIDTTVSRLSQDKPQPIFLTDAGNSKQRKIAEEGNRFIQGEFFRARAYELGPMILRDACIFGTGLLKVFPRDGKVCVERRIETELLTDYNDSYYGHPRQLIEVKLVDRSVMLQLFPDKADMILSAVHGNVDNTPRSTESIADQFIVAEAWHLKSGRDATDGRHSIVCSAGVLEDGEYDKEYFPFVKQTFNPNIVGWFGQGLAEILFPTQMEIYRQLIVGSQAFELMGSPKILIEEMSKVMETSFNNRIGTIIKYLNTKPEFVTPSSIGPDWMPFVEWLIQNAYQISGISALSASGIKPAGLNSGESIREYQGVQDSRTASLEQRYQKMYLDLSEQMVDCARDITESEGDKYTTIYAGKDGTHEIDFRSIGLLKDKYVIQLYEQSSLPKDPAGRQAKLSEMFAAGEITQQEFRRMSAFPDLQQDDQLAFALENRILYDLDAIVEDVKFNAPDPFILDPQDLATQLTTKYINKWSISELKEERMDMLRNYFTQIQDLKQAAMPPQVQQPVPQIPGQGGPPQLSVVPPSPSVSPASNAHV